MYIYIYIKYIKFKIYYNFFIFIKIITSKKYNQIN